MDTTLEESKLAKLPRWAYLGIMVVMVLIATVVNSCIGTGGFHNSCFGSYSHGCQLLNWSR